MRSQRIIVVAAFSLTAVLLTYISLWPSQLSPTSKASAAESKNGILAFFALRPPFSFPPNALITLTHDNTTAFLAKPAAFGPPLPKAGLKAPVWIGGGLVDIASGGELGCSDVPGWEHQYSKSISTSYDGIQTADKQRAYHFKFEFMGGSKNNEALPEKLSEAFANNSPLTRPPIDDGTDDHLHQQFPSSRVSDASERSSFGPKGHHADILSIQEGAEISGKIVLLSRGGCGFLEKAKWSQRRGAVALIVGDDSKGGPLIQMYAKGDTSSITIPSLFTSYTTAHLLCSLAGPGLLSEDNVSQGGWKLPLSSKQNGSVKRPHKTSNPYPTFLSSAKKPVSTQLNEKKKWFFETDGRSQVVPYEKSGWLKSILFGVSGLTFNSESRRPPSSGQIKWSLTDQLKDDDGSKPKRESTSLNKHSNSNTESEFKTSNSKSSDGKAGLEHDFIIGVQDWRDPDLVAITKMGDVKQTGKESQATRSGNPKSSTNTSTLEPSKKQLDGAPKDIPEYFPLGGIATPSSGEYTIQGSHSDQIKETHKDKAEGDREDNSKGIFNTLFGDNYNENANFPSDIKPSPKSNQDSEKSDYEELWITLTPSTGASPFFETLLVLVVSPLITLTIVYALLLIRSRTRRRRWRAPKSVVARLPVRTYHSITSPATNSPRVASPCSISATAPLLQSVPKPRPRSQTTSGIPESSDFIRCSSPKQSLANSPRRNEHEKTSSESSEWTKHMGRQVECVVCLEEYVDGVSRVMGLPCGHEFHVDCITPWLTTRRRTCPICKGDVIRSLAAGTGISHRYDTLHDDSVDEESAHPQGNQNTTNTQSSLVETDMNARDDVELGGALDSVRHSRINIAQSLRGLLPSSFRLRPHDPRLIQQDRNR